MKLLADENIPLKAVEDLRGRGIDVISVLSVARGLKDEEVLSVANRQGRVLVTFDKDFGGLVFKAKVKIKGLILLRFTPRTPEDVSLKIKGLIDASIPIENHFVIVAEDRVRVVPLK